jgi:hypothetical protein
MFVASVAAWRKWSLGDRAPTAAELEVVVVVDGSGSRAVVSG